MSRQLLVLLVVIVIVVGGLVVLSGRATERPTTHVEKAVSLDNLS